MSPMPDLSQYVEVAERISVFREKHPQGSLQVELLDLPPAFADKFIAIRAIAYRGPEDERPGIDFAWEPVPGKTSFTRDSELMNASTSAIGRAIVAALAADTKRGIASAEEVRNRQAENGDRKKSRAGGRPNQGASDAHSSDETTGPPPASLWLRELAEQYAPEHIVTIAEEVRKQHGAATKPITDWDDLAARPLTPASQTLIEHLLKEDLDWSEAPGINPAVEPPVPTPNVASGPQSDPLEALNKARAAQHRPKQGSSLPNASCDKARIAFDPTKGEFCPSCGWPAAQALGESGDAAGDGSPGSPLPEEAK